MGFVAAHVRPHRGALAVSYGAAVIESTLELLYPFAIGLAVDGLLDGSWGGVTLFVLLSLAHTCLGALARDLGEPLLFKGGDFALTDIELVVEPIKRKRLSEVVAAYTAEAR